jgi:hypothetical protein
VRQLKTKITRKPKLFMTALTKPAKNAIRQDYHTTISTLASARETFSKINDVAAWWSKNFGGRAQKLNDTFTVRFGEIWKSFKVIELVANRKMVWEVTACHMPWLVDKQEWKGTKLVWEITGKKDSTQVNFTHLGLTPDVECYDVCDQGWTFFIHESLLKWLNENKGDPHEE